MTGKLAGFAPNAKVIHVDIDPAEIGKNRVADVPIVGDCKDVIGKLAAELHKRQEEAGGVPDRSAWLGQLREWRQTYPYRYDETDGKLKPQYCVERLRALADDDTICVSGVGQHQMYASQFWRFEHPRTWINSGGLGTMGFAVPAAIGAKRARPDAEVWAVVGDGGFQMTMCELATIVQEQIDINVAIINNGYLGMVRQWQEFFYERRYAATPLVNPNFQKLAEAFGLPAATVTKRTEVIPAVEAARKNRQTMVIDFVVEQEDTVYPMVPAGADLDAMIRRPSPSPIIETGADVL